MTARISGAVDDLDADLAATAHRIVQEALTNAFRYAPGAAVRIDLQGGRLVRLDVSNDAPASSATCGGQKADGRQVDLPDTAGEPLGLTGTGRGLLGMQERVSALGGQLSWGPSPTGGWYVAAILPQPVPCGS